MQDRPEKTKATDGNWPRPLTKFMNTLYRSQQKCWKNLWAVSLLRIHPKNCIFTCRRAATRYNRNYHKQRHQHDLPDGDTILKNRPFSVFSAMSSDSKLPMICQEQNRYTWLKVDLPVIVVIGENHDINGSSIHAMFNYSLQQNCWNLFL